MKPLSLAAAAAFSLAMTAHAQFGGVFNKAKEKLDEATQKAKPVSDRAQRAVDTFQPWTAKEEQEIGEASAAKMVAVFGLVDNPKLVRYVNLVGQAVGQYASRSLPWRFGVLDSDIVGAYALPGGYVFITRGALNSMTSEAQLAGALGHEITHCAERHLEREIRSKKTSAWAVEEAGTAGKTGDLASVKADAFVKDLFNTTLSRDKEDAADEQGTKLAARAGYSAAGLVELLTVMGNSSKEPANQQMFGQMLSTHPSFDSRVARLRPIADQAGARGQTLEARFQSSISAQ